MQADALLTVDRLRILQVRGQAVVLDNDLAAVYGVETKQFNRSVKRNANRFPVDFAFQLGPEEFADLRYQIGTSSSQGSRRYPPWVFTVHGAIMTVTILSSPRAVAMSVYVVRAFVRLRNELQANTTLRNAWRTSRKP